jgi:hypothetical protein
MNIITKLLNFFKGNDDYLVDQFMEYDDEKFKEEIIKLKWKNLDGGSKS